MTRERETEIRALHSKHTVNGAHYKAVADLLIALDEERARTDHLKDRILTMRAGLRDIVNNNLAVDVLRKDDELAGLSNVRRLI